MDPKKRAEMRQEQQKLLIALRTARGDLATRRQASQDKHEKQVLGIQIRALRERLQTIVALRRRQAGKQQAQKPGGQKPGKPAGKQPGKPGKDKPMPGV